MILIHIMPTGQEDEKTFKQTQDYLDRQQWVGSQCSYEIPGGGNADSDQDVDPIERMK